MSLIAELARRVVRFDGAMGTMLLDRGLGLGTPPERWVLDRADEVLAVHRAYIDAGAEVLTTCTFGANAIHLARAGLAERGEEICRRAVALAREAGGGHCWIAGDLGPIWPPAGAANAPSASERTEAYAEHARWLAAAGADVLLVETQLALDEARTALAAARATGRPVIVTMTYGTPERLADAALAGAEAASLERAGAAAVGANCMLTAEHLRPVVVGMVKTTALPVVARPNAGQPRRTGDGRFVYEETPQGFARGIAALAEAGAHGVGGCCGTTPAMIAAARTALSSARAGS
ncbi:MAG: homocysteine S-methyltransferase family protein [bacterium]